MPPGKFTKVPVLENVPPFLFIKTPPKLFVNILSSNSLLYSPRLINRPEFIFELLLLSLLIMLLNSFKKTLPGKLLMAEPAAIFIVP